MPSVTPSSNVSPGVSGANTGNKMLLFQQTLMAALKNADPEATIKISMTPPDPTHEENRSWRFEVSTKNGDGTDRNLPQNVRYIVDSIMRHSPYKGHSYSVCIDEDELSRMQIFISPNPGR